VATSGYLNFRAKDAQTAYEKASAAATDPANAATRAELEKTKDELAVASVAAKKSPFNYAFDYVLLPCRPRSSPCCILRGLGRISGVPRAHVQSACS